MRLENIPLKIESTIYRVAYDLGNRKPSSSPYISGDGFRLMCDHFYEGKKRSHFRASAVRAGEIVFCEAWHLVEFLRGPARDVNARFSIVSHNGDYNVDASVLSLLPPNLDRLFAQNVIVENERAVALPIGLENKRLHYNGVIKDFDKLRSREIEKVPRILSSFTVENNSTVRELALKQLSESTLNDNIGRVNSRAYRKLAARYMFIASPPGNGVDCHRTWEAMYLRAVPIVKKSHLTMTFVGKGLPVYAVDSYDEAARWSRDELSAIYEELSPRFKSDALWLSFWEKQIRRAAIEGEHTKDRNDRVDR